jgi:ribonucleoside-triphosphate reductase
MHLAGEMNISNSGTWGLIPDTIFLDVTNFHENAMDLKGKFLNVSRMPLPGVNNSNDFETYLSLLISLLSREASTEVVLEGIIPMILEQTKEPAEISSRFAKALMLSSVAPSYTQSGLPATTITIPADGHDVTSVTALLGGYQKYVDSTPVPRIGISLIYGDMNDQQNQLRYHLDPIVSLVRSGGIISLSHDDGLRASSGIRKSIGGKSSGTVITLQSLSINLPRLAYQSNKDETYFRARLALMIKPAIAALYIRKKAVAELIRKGTVPALTGNSDFIQSGTTNIIINLIGARESVNDILGHHSKNDGMEVLQKVLKTSVDVALDQGRYIGEGSVGVAMIADDSATRFAALDSDKYGRAYLQSTQQNSTTYSQGLTLYGEQLLMPNDDNSGSLIEECLSVDKLLSGGLSVTLDVTELASNHVQLKKAIEAASGIPFFRPMVKLMVCNSCGKRSCSRYLERCEYCRSSHMLLIH